MITKMTEEIRRSIESDVNEIRHELQKPKHLIDEKYIAQIINEMVKNKYQDLYTEMHDEVYDGMGELKLVITNDREVAVMIGGALEPEHRKYVNLDDLVGEFDPEDSPARFLPCEQILTATFVKYLHDLTKIYLEYKND